MKIYVDESCQINCFDCVSIEYHQFGYSNCDYDVNNFCQYIIVSEENLEIIKDVEKQLEEKIDKIIIKENEIKLKANIFKK